MRLTSMSHYAKRTGYSRARISQLVKAGVIILKNGKVDPNQAGAAIREKVFRPQRLEKLTRKLVCDECVGEEQRSTGEYDTFFCKRLNVTITKARDNGRDAMSVRNPTAVLAEGSGKEPKALA